MQLTYFMVQGYNCGNLCQYFISKPKRLTADSCCQISHTRTTKNQKLLFTYVNGAVEKKAWLWYNENCNFISVKTSSKEEQRARSTLQWDQRRTDRTNNNLWLHAFEVKHEQRSRSSLEVKEKQIATHLRRNEAAKWDLNTTWKGNAPGWQSILIIFHTFHTFVEEDSRI